MNIVFSGTPDFVIPIVKSLKNNFNLVAIVTTKSSPIALFANTQNITILDSEKINQELAEELRSLKPDLFVVAAFGKIIPQFILEIPRYGALNIHPSLLPQYRGATPIQSAILNGDKISGLTVIKMDEQVDHGPIVFQEEIRLSNNGTLESLSKKLFNLAAAIIPQIIEEFVSGKIKQRVQNHAIATFCHLIKKEDGYFEIGNPPPIETLNRMIRAYFPWPNVWTRWQGKIVKFYPKGTIQLEGKNKTTLKEFLNGHPDFPVKIFRPLK